MSSETDIFNLALSHLGQAADVSSPTEQSVDAQHCLRFYSIALNEMLEGFDWSFARKRSTLAELPIDRPDFLYKYQRPSDCLLERRFLWPDYTSDPDDVTRWQRDTDFIYTNEALSVLVYTMLLEDTTKFSTQFTVGLTWKLAGYISGPIIKDPTGQTQIRLMQVAEREINKAKVVDANLDRNRAIYVNTAQRAHGDFEIRDQVDREFD